MKSELHFLRTYKEFIFVFNMFERNIGYCLRHCVQNRNPKKWLEVSFDAKVKKLMLLVASVNLTEKFSGLHEDLEKCRRLRNVLVHGEWRWKENQPKPIHYHCPEIENEEGYISNSEFDTRLVFLKSVFDNFDRLRDQLEQEIEKTPNKSAHTTPAIAPR